MKIKFKKIIKAIYCFCFGCDPISFDKENKPVEYSEVRIKADMYKHKIYLHNDNISNNPS